MKYLLITLILITSVMASSFCRGFEEGYKRGWCYGQNFCVDPVPPVCPVARVGEYTFADGYDRGFMLGLSRKRR